MENIILSRWLVIINKNINQREEPVNLVKSIDRALDIIVLLSNSKEPLGITKISSLLGLPKSTVSRLLSTLQYRGFVVKDDEFKRYSLGLRLFQIGSDIFKELELPNKVRPYLNELVELTNETVHLVIDNDGEVIYIDKAESDNMFRQYSQIGKKAPLHCTAVGKSVLANKPQKEIEEFINKNDFKKYTSNTITDPNKLLEELRKVKEQGYAIDNCEIQEELICVGAPIFNYSNQVIGAISVSGPKTRMNDLDSKTKNVKLIANKISSLLGSD